MKTGHCQWLAIAGIKSPLWLNSAIVGFNRSSNSNRSCRRRLAHGANPNASRCSRPRSRHNLFLHSRPSFSATACTRLHHAVPVPQQLPQIPILPARHPDGRKAVLQQRTQNMLRIFSIRLLFAPRLRRISDASPIHNSNCSSASSRSNQRPCPLASIPGDP